MLGKLIKYELSATARRFIPLYIGLIAFSIFINISTSIININDAKSIYYQNSLGRVLLSTALTISTFIYISIIIAIIIMTLVISIQRFYKNLLSDEGYLMFTLPVCTHKLILSKFLTTLIWGVCSFLFMIISLIIIVPGGFSFISTVINNISYIYSQIASVPILLQFFILLTINIILNFPFLILTLYASIAIGHLAHKYRALLSFVTFIGLSIIIAIITNIFSDIFSDLLPIPQINSSNSISNYIDYGFITLNSFLIFSIVLCVILSVVFYFVTHYILSKKLNLD